MDIIISILQNEINNYTYPVFAKTNNKPELVASSVIVEVLGDFYFITASHAISQIFHISSPLIIGVNCKYVNISGEFVCSFESRKDNFDIAYIKLSPEFVVKNKITPLRSGKLLLGKMPNCHVAFIHGYPCSKNKQSKALWNTTSFKLNTYGYAGVIKKNFPNWDKFNKNKNDHTCMSYQKTLNKPTPTHPKGLSGGGLWIIPSVLAPDKYYLDSILIEFFRNDSIVFATKMTKIIEFILETS